MSHLLQLVLAGFVGGVAALVMQYVIQRLDARRWGRDLALWARDRASLRRLWARLTPEQREAVRRAARQADAPEFAEDVLKVQAAPKLPRERHLHGLWVMLGLDE